jgi:hypothetical protein
MEDKLANEIVSDYRESEFILEVQPEAHYHHYGTRGVADIFARREKSTTVISTRESLISCTR